MATFTGNFLDFASTTGTLDTGTNPDSSYVDIDLYNDDFARITLDFSIDQSIYKRITDYDFTPPYTDDDHVDEIDIYAYDKDGVRTTIISSNTDYTSARNYDGGINDLPENCVRITCMVILEDIGSTGYVFSSTFRGDWEIQAEDKIVSPPQNLSVIANTGNSITLEWEQPSDITDLAGYKVRYGVGTITTNDTTATIFNINEGETYTFNVIAYNIYGVESSSIQITVTAQNVDPTMPGNLSIDGFTENTLSISWNPSSDNVGVTAYRIYLDDVLKATTTATHYTFNGLDGGKLYTLSVSAKDAVGNESDKNSIQARTFFKHAGLTLPSENPFVTEVINYIRDMVNEFRTRNGLDIIIWTDSTITRKYTPIKAIHWNEIEDAILGVYTQLGFELNNQDAKQQFEETIKVKDQRYPLELLPRRIENILIGLQNS
ncbi:fibronectin type III domain-containing protein [Chengkuizengella axinellae]|uniref:Fibronectin type III domain-containing protein n=1 Tax=Chengkuizengella axinellae TaxID=3064388 RepID=A0ABT9J6N7_9BACL|nr:fibronectin type III domain-containing protein [Chengkuizengella sp. 2205SS18-9]MDP5277254.1 fibronectin type III domain-containing protein [Chengkuizengella sp. 2205SS18-9]